MPITRSAKKALRQSDRKGVFNARRKNKMDDAVKKIKKLVSAKKVDEAKTLLASAYKAIDKATKGKTIKKNNASRTKSRLAQMLKKAGAK
jgi:small subunit ribosomal protein S20